MPSSGTVVITGASTGIGRATALRLARAGFVVLAGVRREEDGAALRAQDAAHRAGARRRDRRRPDRAPRRARRRRPAGRARQQRRHRGRRAAGGRPARPRAPPVRGQRLRAAGRDPGPARPHPRRPGADRQHRLDRRAHQHAVRRALQLLQGGRAQSQCRAAARAAPVGHPRRPRRAGRAGHPDLAQGRRGRRRRSSTRCPTAYAPSTPVRSTRCVAATRKIAAGASSPDEAAQAVEHALTAERPKAVYTVGRRARVQGALHSVLPARAVRRARRAGDEDRVAAPRGFRLPRARLRRCTRLPPHRGEGVALGVSACLYASHRDAIRGRPHDDRAPAQALRNALDCAGTPRRAPPMRAERQGAAAHRHLLPSMRP